MAFNEYCLLGPGRSLAKLAEKGGKSTVYVRQLERWSSAYGWVTRAREYDTILAKKMREEFEEEWKQNLSTIRDMLLKHINGEVEVTATSQLQAAKLLLEHFVWGDRLDQMNEQLCEIEEALRAMGASI